MFLDKLKKSKYILICNCYANQKCNRYINTDGALCPELFPITNYKPKIYYNIIRKQ
jgi:hypothetical protein